jgi:hypothetical protein
MERHTEYVPERSEQAKAELLMSHITSMRFLIGNLYLSSLGKTVLSFTGSSPMTYF